MGAEVDTIFCWQRMKRVINFLAAVSDKMTWCACDADLHSGGSMIADIESKM